MKADIARVAYDKRVSEEEVAEAIAFQERFVEYAQKIDARFPNQISRIWLEPVPSTQAFIQFTDDVPVGEAPKNVQLFSDEILTRAQHARHAEAAADALKADGYRNFLTHFDAAQGAIRIEMVIDEDAWEPDREKLIEVHDEIQFAEAKSGQALNAKPSKIDLRILRRAEPIYTAEWSRGGLWCRDDGANECTSGWAAPPTSATAPTTSKPPA